MLKAAQSGKPVNLGELPPPVATGTVIRLNECVLCFNLLE
jgi:hypothetical protein